jgi:hypothetical protein
MAAHINQIVSTGPFSITTASAQEAVLVANTPSFLLDRLRKDVAVQTITANLGGREIVSALRSALTPRPDGVLGIVTAYVYLVALSYSDPQDAELWKEIAALDLSSLEWGDTIRGLIVAESVPTITMDLSASDKLCP